MKDSDEDDSDEDDSDEDEDSSESESFEDEPDDDEIAAKGADEETPFTNEDTDEDEQKRKTMAIMLAFCFLFLLAIAIGLGVGLSKRNDNEPAPIPTPTVQAPTVAPAPTDPPVRMPVSLPPRSPLPTDAPTGDGPAPFVPQSVESSADTTIYRDGLNVEQSFGSEETMLVQSGVPGNVDLPSAFALVQFDLNTTVPTDVDAFLCLSHVQEDDSNDNTTTTYRACSLPPTDLDVESLTGSDATYTIPNDCLSEVVQFLVSPEDEVVCVNVAPALFLGSTPVRNLRGRHRRLQNGASYLLMIDALGPGSDQPGDRFFTRQSPDPSRRPTLELSEATLPPTDVNSTIPPSTIPPDITIPPGNETGTFDPCGVCPEGQDVTIPGALLPVPPEMLPEGISGEEATCAFVDTFCGNGGCNGEICGLIASASAAITPICGCSSEVSV